MWTDTDSRYVVFGLDIAAVAWAAAALLWPCCAACGRSMRAYAAQEAADRAGAHVQHVHGHAHAASHGRGTRRSRGPSFAGAIDSSGGGSGQPGVVKSKLLPGGVAAPFYAFSTAANVASRRRHLWGFATVMPLLLSVAMMAASVSNAVELYDEPPSSEDVRLITVSAYLEVALWMLAALAVWVRAVSFAPGSCSMPLLWALALGTQVYALAAGIRPGDGYTRPEDVSRSNGILWASVCAAGSLVVFGWCCCWLNAGVHELLTGVADPPTPPRQGATGDNKGAATPLLDTANDSSYGAAARSAASGESKADGGAASSSVVSGTSSTAAVVGGVAGSAAVVPAHVSKVEAGLVPQDVAKFYNAFGMLQDYERLYTDKATSHLRRHATLGAAGCVLEFGCGTGALAVSMLENDLPNRCKYIGTDISSTMVDITTKRVAKYGPRAEVILSDGSPELSDIATGSVDRIVSTYVFDALKDEYITRLLASMARVLGPDGRLCITSLTFGNTPFAAGMTSMWVGMYKCAPSWLGGCRPLEVSKLLAAHGWTIESSTCITQLALTSEVVIAGPPVASGTDAA